MLKSKDDQKQLQQKFQASNSYRSFEDDLNDYSSIRLTSLNKPSTSTGASTYTSPIKSPTSVISIPDDDSEIEEGEIVEREVTQCVDLIEESFSVLKNSRKITDLSPMKNTLFFEDKRSDNSKCPLLSPPLYKTVGDVNESQDVIIIDSTMNSTASPDDSVIFVSEEQKPLQKPNVLLSPALNELMKISGIKLTPASHEKKKLLSPGQVKRRERLAAWRKKKQIQYAQKEVADAMAGNKSDNHQQPSTSTYAAAPNNVKKAKEKSNGEKKKRIILIDGSNVAITHAKSMLGRDFDEKCPNAFSVEGKIKFISVEIFISKTLYRFKHCTKIFREYGFSSQGSNTRIPIDTRQVIKSTAFTTTKV